MLSSFAEAQRNSDARARSSGKGGKKRQVGPAEQLEWVKRFKASSAKNATEFAKQHPRDLVPKTFRTWVAAEKSGKLEAKVAQVAPSRDGTAGKRVRKSNWPELEEKVNQYIDLRMRARGPAAIYTYSTQQTISGSGIR